MRHCAYLYDWLDISDRAGRPPPFSHRLPRPSRLIAPIQPVTPSSCIWRWRSMPAGSIRLGSMWTCIAMASHETVV